MGTVTGSDVFRFAPCGARRCCVRCPACTGSRPAELTVTLSGIMNGSCDECINFNGSWVLPFAGHLESTQHCRTTWRGDFFDIPACFGFLSIVLQVSYLPLIRQRGLFVDVENYPAAPTLISYRIAPEAGPDPYACSEFTNFNVPRDVEFPSLYCNDIISECKISA